MEGDGVEAWLKHWPKLQKKGKHPLVLKGPLPLDASPKAPPRREHCGQPRTRKGKNHYVEVEDSIQEEVDNGLTADGIEVDGPMHAHSISTNKDTAGLEVKILPPSPHSASKNHST